MLPSNIFGSSLDLSVYRNPDGDVSIWLRQNGTLLKAVLLSEQQAEVLAMFLDGEQVPVAKLPYYFES